jgi:hypothetical protein
MTTTATDAEVDFGAECREAFHRLAREHAAINPNEWGRRLQNQKLRLRKHVAIDAVLDQHAEWLELLRLEEAS